MLGEIVQRFHSANRNSKADPYTSLTTSQVATPSTRLRTRTHLASQEHLKEPLHIIISSRLEIGSHLCQFIAYYRIYAASEDRALLSSTPVSPGDPFLGRIEVGTNQKKEETNAFGKY